MSDRRRVSEETPFFQMEPSRLCEISPLPGVICTTPVKGEVTALGHAVELSEWFGCRFVPRKRRSIHQLLLEEDAMQVIVADTEPRLYHREQPDTPLFFHPGMAMQRTHHLLRGEPDRLISAAQVRHGDTVLDATLGAGSDTLVLAEAVGKTGHVISLEAVPALARLFVWAQRRDFLPYQEVSHLAPRIEVFEVNHVDFLQNLEDDSVDVVYFDPMFQHAITNPSANMDAMRPFTHSGSVTLPAMKEARRVARRCVVVKERPWSGEFERLDLCPDKPRARVAYGVWYKEGDLCHDR